jgi:hypothetical protein
MIPENMSDFLYWVKEKTEAYWDKSHQPPGDNWIYGAKWIGMREEEIDGAEAKYSVKFTPDHREFLKILHTIDRQEIIVHTSISAEEDVKLVKRPFFYNWMEDEKEIRDRLEWPCQTILQDITGRSKFWIDSWGKCPDDPEEREAVFIRFYKDAPKLLPLTSHRFLVSEPVQPGNPVLSVWGSDIIIYGWTLRTFLIDNFLAELDLLEPYYDEEEKVWYSQDKKEAQSIRDKGYAENRNIPFWSEIIDDSGWVYKPSNNREN